jgi:hypothetical protein
VPLASLHPRYAAADSPATRFPRSAAGQASWRHCCCPAAAASRAKTNADTSLAYAHRQPCTPKIGRTMVSQDVRSAYGDHPDVPAPGERVTVALPAVGRERHALHGEVGQMGDRHGAVAGERRVQTRLFAGVSFHSTPGAATVPHEHDLRAPQTRRDDPWTRTTST